MASQPNATANSLFIPTRYWLVSSLRCVYDFCASVFDIGNCLLHFYRRIVKPVATHLFNLKRSHCSIAELIVNTKYARCDDVLSIVVVCAWAGRQTIQVYWASHCYFHSIKNDEISTNNFAHLVGLFLFFGCFIRISLAAHLQSTSRDCVSVRQFHISFYTIDRSSNFLSFGMLRKRMFPSLTWLFSRIFCLCCTNATAHQAVSYDQRWMKFYAVCMLANFSIRLFDCNQHHQSERCVYCVCI